MSLQHHCKKVTDFTFNFEDRLVLLLLIFQKTTQTSSMTLSLCWTYRLNVLEITGEFKLQQWCACFNPLPPKPLDDAMHIATINLNPYVLDY